VPPDGDLGQWHLTLTERFLVLEVTLEHSHLLHPIRDVVFDLFDLALVQVPLGQHRLDYSEDLAARLDNLETVLGELEEVRVRSFLAGSTEKKRESKLTMEQMPKRGAKKMANCISRSALYMEAN